MIKIWNCTVSLPDTDETGNESVESVNSSNIHSDANGSTSKEKYSIVVTRNGWDKSGNKGRGKKRTVPQISGLDESENKEMFVYGLKCADFKNKNDLEKSIRLYCLDRSINLVYHRVLAFKSDRVTVGCKVVVKNCDVEKISSKGFWPSNIKIKDWYDDPEEKVPSSSDERSSSDEFN